MDFNPVFEAQHKSHRATLGATTKNQKTESFKKKTIYFKNLIGLPSNAVCSAFLVRDEFNMKHPCPHLCNMDAGVFIEGIFYLSTSQAIYNNNESYYCAHRHTHRVKSFKRGKQVKRKTRIS